MKVLKTKNKREREDDKFVKILLKMPPEQFLGVVRLLNINMMRGMEEKEIEREIEELEKEIKRREEKKKVLEENLEKTEEKSDVAADAIKNGDGEEKEEEKDNQLDFMRQRLENLQGDDQSLKVKPLDGQELFYQLTTKFKTLSATKRRNLLAILKAANY